MSDLLWELSAVSVRGLKLPRLESVNLRLHSGVTAIIGSSGAGKTSLLNLLAGFESPDEGIVSGSPRVAWAPQSGGLWPHLTVREHMQVAGPATDNDERMNLLAAFDLAGKMGSRPDELSEGEQSRLNVVRALVMPAAVLVMDEPLVHVDSARAETCWKAIRQRLAAANASLVFTTHAPEEVLAEANRAVCLKDGRVLHEGSVADLYWNPPSSDLARFLGPANWFEPAEALHWLGMKEVTARCWRPEQIEIQSVTGGNGFVVESARFHGSMAEADLIDSLSGKVRRFYHRPARRQLHTGQRVAMRVIS